MAVAAQRDVHYPIYVMTPFEAYDSLWGKDLASHPLLFQTIERASESGSLAMTPPTVLVSEAGTVHSIWLFHVVYDQAPQTSFQAQQPIRGVVGGVVQPRRILAALRSEQDAHYVTVTIRDEQAPATRDLIKSPATSTASAAPEQPRAAHDGWRVASVGEMSDAHDAALDASTHVQEAPYTHLAQITIVDRPWRIAATPTDAFLATTGSWAPTGVLFAGLLITVLSALYMHSLLVRHQRVEEQVAHRTAELQETNTSLQRTNETLEEFAHVAAHDLQEPLSKIRHFADMLISDVGRSLGEQHRYYLHRMRDACVRMHALIDGLLGYSRATRHKPRSEPTDLNQILREVRNDLALRTKQVGGRYRSTNCRPSRRIRF